MAVDEITSEEKLIVNKIRGNIAELKKSKEQFDDGFIVRWLRAHLNDPEQCETALKKHLAFRKVWGLDDPKEKWRISEVIKTYFGYGYCGVDKEGSPILIEFFGNLDVEGIIKCCPVSDYIKIALYVVEEGQKQCREIATKKGTPYEPILCIMDMNNMTSSHYTYKPFTNSYLSMIALFQENYPLVFKKIMVPRAPNMAAYAFSLLGPYLGNSTTQLIEMLGDDWQTSLLSYIDADQLPECCGGTRPDKNLNLGVGPVPEKFFYVPTEEDLALEQLTIYAGDKHILDLEVTKPNQTIKWAYKTQAEDIGFAIYFNPGGEATELTEMELICPYIRLECAMIPERGQVQVEKAGKYVVEFDNNYSWFSAKELFFKMSVV